MPTIDEVATSAAGAIDGITGLRAKAWADEIINEPEVHIFTREFDPHYVFGQTKHPMPFTARLFVKAADARTAQKLLRSFMEPTSVPSKIETISGWTGNGASVDDATVTLISAPAQIDLAGVVRWFVDFEFEVIF